MLSCDWLPYGKARRCLTAALVLGCGLVLSEAGQANEQAAAQQRETSRPANAQPIPALASEQEKLNTTHYSADCDQPKDHDGADYCQQRRMAQAAEDTLFLNKVQLGIGVLGTLLLLATLYFTARATVAASRAANAADRAVEVGAKNAEAQLRAYVYPAKPEVKFGPNGIAAVNVPFENAGQTPAHDFGSWLHIDVVPYPVKDVPEVKAPANMSRTPLRPGGGVSNNVKRRCSTEEIEKIAKGKMVLVVYGIATYHDIFNEVERTTRIRFMYFGPWTGTQRLKVCPEGNEAT